MKLMEYSSRWIGSFRCSLPKWAVRGSDCLAWPFLTQSAVSEKHFSGRVRILEALAEMSCLLLQTVAPFYFTDYLIIQPPSPSKSTSCVVKASREEMEICSKSSSSSSSNGKFAWDWKRLKDYFLKWVHSNKIV